MTTITPDLLDALTQRGVSLHRVTLHVGAGTFLPVKTETPEDHRLHAIAARRREQALAERERD